jgi:large subunit ribosomal protein L4
MPLRRDLLHRAVVYEGDAHRKGTASTKWRSEVHGSNRKIQPQKGTGRARAGDKKSPIRTGGGVAHGPKPRSFATGLQRKVYDQAWRTALSHRYRRGELIIIEDDLLLPPSAGARFLANLFENNQWGKGYRRSMLVADVIPKDLASAIKDVGEHGLIKDIEDVDVKDMLETGRIVIERKALDALLIAHSSDIVEKVPLDLARRHIQTELRGSLKRFESKLGTNFP